MRIGSETRERVKYMNNYNYCVPTDIRFGKEQIECLAEEIGKVGKKVLLVYGGGSIKKTGLYDKVYEVLKDFEIFELSGIEPNPKVTSVRKGVAICKENGIDAILAVGGGSTIDASKHIAARHFMTETHGTLCWINQRRSKLSLYLQWLQYVPQARR